MRFLVNVSMPHDKFNAAVQDGSVGQKMSRILEDSNPEAVYFTEQNGQRHCTMVVNIDDASQIPSLAEPWFLQFRATAEFRIAMTPADLEKAGLEELGRKWA